MKRILFVLTLGILLLQTTATWSNGVGIVDGSTGIYLTLLNSDINVSVNNQIATISVTQIFKNETGSETNFKYGFPLNEGANPIRLRWFQNGVWSVAVVGSNSQNDTIPGTGGSSTIDPDLVEYLGDFPLFFGFEDSLGIDSTIIIELAYVELLPYFQGKVSFYYPNDISLIQSSVLNQQLFTFQLFSEREISTIDAVGLNTSDSITTYMAILSFEQTGGLADFNYYIEYELASNGLGVIPLSIFTPDTLFDCDTLGNGYCTFIIEPESNVNTEVIEKNFTLIIDRSGSMGGNKIVQARDAATYIVNNLNLGDYFNIIDFSSTINSLFNNHVVYNTQNQNTALDYIQTLNSGGSTNISGALITAISQFQVVDTTKANIILFFTDGQATAGITNTNDILTAVQNEVQFAETSIFLFPFGIGQDANPALLTLLAQQNNGIANFIEAQNLQEEIITFFQTINSPVLINTDITFIPNILEETYPLPIPNLYKGQQLIISGRYSSPQPIVMHLEGQAFNIPVSYDFQLNLSDSNDISKSVLPKIWAKQKIDALTTQIYLAENQNQVELLEAVIDSISTCYGVVSLEFSSFVNPGGGLEIDETSISDSSFNIIIKNNPFTNYFEIQITSTTHVSKDIKIEIVDFSGRTLLSKKESMEGSLLQIRIDELNDMNSGIYLCCILIGDQFYYFKIVKVSP